MKKFLILFLSLVIFFYSAKNSLAVYDPLSVPNNIYGIHVQDENDLNGAISLVNSSGGGWGYVTLVITENERNTERWQRVFDKLRRNHVIPIIRIATAADGNKWKEPAFDDIDNWVSFLNSLNWVIKNRYVVIGNEPNHAVEWGGKVDPESYATYLKDFSTKLKIASGDFYVLPAGLDASAPNSRSTMDESLFISRMLKSEPDIFSYVDGWTSHSYPNPNFSGSERDRGRGTITTYDWELNYLRSLSVSKNLPVFITETGWSDEKLNHEEIGKRLKYSYSEVWSDKRIVAVTPFLLNYTTPPFEVFSWKNKDGTFKSFYDDVKGIKKTKGEPVQEVKGKILGVFVNPFVIANSSLKGIVLAQNLGQSIWVSSEIKIEDVSQQITIDTENYGEVEPNKLRLMHVKISELKNAGTNEIPLVIKYKDAKSVSEAHNSQIVVVEETKLKKLGFFAKIQVWVLRLFTNI